MTRVNQIITLLYSFLVLSLSGPLGKYTYNIKNDLTLRFNLLSKIAYNDFISFYNTIIFGIIYFFRKGLPIITIMLSGYNFLVYMLDYILSTDFVSLYIFIIISFTISNLYFIYMIHNYHNKGKVTFTLSRCINYFKHIFFKINRLCALILTIGIMFAFRSSILYNIGYYENCNIYILFHVVISIMPITLLVITICHTLINYNNIKASEISKGKVFRPFFVIYNKLIMSYETTMNGNIVYIIVLFYILLSIVNIYLPEITMLFVNNPILSYLIGYLPVISSILHNINMRDTGWIYMEHYFKGGQYHYYWNKGESSNTNPGQNPNPGSNPSSSNVDVSHREEEQEDSDIEREQEESDRKRKQDDSRFYAIPHEYTEEDLQDKDFDTRKDTCLPKEQNTLEDLQHSNSTLFCRLGITNIINNMLFKKPVTTLDAIVKQMVSKNITCNQIMSAGELNSDGTVRVTKNPLDLHKPNTDQQVYLLCKKLANLINCEVMVKESEIVFNKNKFVNLTNKRWEVAIRDIWKDLNQQEKVLLVKCIATNRAKFEPFKRYISDDPDTDWGIYQSLPIATNLRGYIIPNKINHYGIGNQKLPKALIAAASKKNSEIASLISEQEKSAFNLKKFKEQEREAFRDLRKNSDEYGLYEWAESSRSGKRPKR